MRDDEARRHLEDLEKRVARLEAAAAVKKEEYIAEAVATAAKQYPGQFCLCGREVCRAPARPTFQPDPLGR